MSNDPIREHASFGRTSSKITIDLEVCANEPLMRYIAQACQCKTACLIIGFYAVVTIPMFALHYLSDPTCSPNEHYLTFIDSISWSLPMLFLFPFIIGLSLTYYRAIPPMFEYLINETLEDTSSSSIYDFLHILRRKLVGPKSPLMIFALSLILNGIYFWQALNLQRLDWMNDGFLLQEWLQSARGLSWAGLYAMVVQVVLVYLVVNLLWKGIMVAYGLHEFFNRKDFAITLDPLHVDGVCGLRPIGRVSSILNVILFLLGIYLSLKVIDKIIIQGASIYEDVGNPAMLISYAVLAPLLFFLPLMTAHDRMLETRDGFLRPLGKRCEKSIRSIGDARLDQEGLGRLDPNHIEAIANFEKLRVDLKRKIPVWPFDFKSLQAFFVTIVVPLLPVILPIIIQYLVRSAP